MCALPKMVRVDQGAARTQRLLLLLPGLRRVPLARRRIIPRLSPCDSRVALWHRAERHSPARVRAWRNATGRALGWWGAIGRARRRADLFVPPCGEPR